MLLDPGPLALFTDAQIPVSAPRAGASGDALGIAEAFERAAAALGDPGSRVAGGLGDAGGAVDPSDLGAAWAVIADVAGDFASPLGRAAASAADLEGELAGLAGEMGAVGAGAAFPIAPDLPRGDELPPDYVGDAWTAWDTFTIGVYRTFLDRGPSRDELVSARLFSPSTDALKEFVLRSDEYRRGAAGELPAPVPPPAVPPPPAPAPVPAPPADRVPSWFRGGVAALYREHLGREPEPGIVEAYWDGEASLDAIREGIFASEEYRARTGG